VILEGNDLLTLGVDFGEVVKLDCGLCLDSWRSGRKLCHSFFLFPFLCFFVFSLPFFSCAVTEEEKKGVDLLYFIFPPSFLTFRNITMFYPVLVALAHIAICCFTFLLYSESSTIFMFLFANLLLF
jgi:hypothetical protein